MVIVIVLSNDALVDYTASLAINSTNKSFKKYLDISK